MHLLLIATLSLKLAIHYKLVEGKKLCVLQIIFALIHILRKFKLLGYFLVVSNDIIYLFLYIHQLRSSCFPWHLELSICRFVLCGFTACRAICNQINNSLNNLERRQVIYWSKGHDVLILFLVNLTNSVSKKTWPQFWHLKYTGNGISRVSRSRCRFSQH